MTTQLISDIETGRLLIFLGFGIALLVFSLNSKLSITIDNGNSKNNAIQRYADVYRFIKTVFNWGILYFIASVFLLLSTVVYFSNDFWRPLFYNIGFIITVTCTTFLTTAYIKLVVFGLLQDMILASRYNL
jgi:hypothetical protein